MTLSLSMIVKNEAKNLPRCLDSVKGLVDEIVIVDTGSTDNTVEIAQSYGAKIGHFDWCDDFSAARNASLDLCTGDWVLVLDADESIDPIDHDAIRNAIQSEEFPAYHFTLRNYFPDSTFSTFDKVALPNFTCYEPARSFPFFSDARAMRLFKRLPEVRWEGKIHELFCRHFTGNGIEIGVLDAVIHHFGKADLELEEAKKTYYYALCEDDHRAHPKDTQMLFNLAIQAHIAGRPDRCLYACEKYIEETKDVPTILLLLAGISHQLLDRHGAAVTYFSLILETKPEHVIAMVHAGISHGCVGNLRDMREFMRLATEVNPEYVNAYLIWAAMEEELGNKDIAKRVLKFGLKINPKDNNLARELGKYQSNSLISKAV